MWRKARRAGLRATITAVVVALGVFIVGPSSHAATTTTLHGRFQVIAIDGAHRAGTAYFVRAAGTLYRLEGMSSFKVASGQPVDVTGTVQGNAIAVSSIDPTGPAPAPAATPGSLHVLVELVYWTAPDSVTTAQAQQQYATTDNTWFQNTSYGNLNVTGSATQWLQIAAPSDPDGSGSDTPCDNIGAIESEGDQAATSAGYNLASYDHYVYYYPQCPAEQWGGWGEVGGNHTWLIGEMDSRVSVHELGHNLGLGHSNLATCTYNGQTVPYSNTCTSQTYGDPISAMGGGFSGQGMYTASQEQALGWLGQGTHTVQNVTASGSFNLVPLESSSGGLQALQVTDSSGVSFWIEYRQPVGNDSFLAPGDTDGVIIRTGSTETLLYDMTGAGTSNAALPAGQSWSNPVGNLKVTVNSATSSGASVSISIGVSQQTVEDSSPLVTYGTWQGMTDAAASGGTYRQNALVGGNASFKFSGTAVKWVTIKGPDKGIANVMIDGVSKGNFDLYSSTKTPYVLTFSGLSSTSHTIKVRVTGTKNSAASGTNVPLDAFIVGTATTQDTSTKVTYGTWSGKTSTSASGGTYRSNPQAPQTVTFTFTGARVDWITTTGPSYGKAEVYLDGVDQGTVDLYAATIHWKTAKTYTASAPGQHTLVIKVLGLKNTASTGKAVIVDAFTVQ